MAGDLLKDKEFVSIYPDDTFLYQGIDASNDGMGKGSLPEYSALLILLHYDKVKENMRFGTPLYLPLVAYLRLRAWFRWC